MLVEMGDEVAAMVAVGIWLVAELPIYCHPVGRESARLPEMAGLGISAT